MTGLEIALLIGGALIFVLSFLIPVRQEEASEDMKGLVEKEVKKKVDEEIEGIRSHIDDVVDEAAIYAQEKTERSLERLSNEKIMAVNEYSDTVLDEINKNHKEVMFLYDMLNDKHENLMSSVSEANEAAKAAHETAIEANEAAIEANEAAVEASEAAEEANVVASSFKTFSAEGLKNIMNDASNEYGDLGKNSQVMGGIEIPEVKSPISMNKVRTLKWAALATEAAEDSYEAQYEAETNALNIQPDDIESTDEVIYRDSEYDAQGALHNEILTLHRLGQSDVEIAKSLGMGVGEVSLIIGLHGNK